jgi:uncharacterized protein
MIKRRITILILGVFSAVVAVHGFIPTPTSLSNTCRDSYRIQSAFTDSMTTYIQLIRQTSSDFLLFGKDGDSDDEDDVARGPAATNVLGTTLCSCCSNVGNSGIGTGFYRNGYCSTGQDDFGRHTVCVQVTDAFLVYSKEVGNDLSTKFPEYLFPGLMYGVCVLNDGYKLMMPGWHRSSF